MEFLIGNKRAFARSTLECICYELRGLGFQARLRQNIMDEMRWAYVRLTINNASKQTLCFQVLVAMCLKNEEDFIIEHIAH